MIGVIDQKVTGEIRARYNRIAPLYDAMDKFMERRWQPFRRQLWAAVPPGRILEVGVGTGKNFPYYPPGTSVTGIDFAEQMLVRARARAAHLGLSIDLREMDVQALRFPDRTFDAAVATCVFCSVPDPVRGLQELGRVVKSDGRIYLLEHVRIDKPVIGTLMDGFSRVTVRVSGANLNRRTVANVRRAGLEIDAVESLGPMSMIKFIVARPPR